MTLVFRTLVALVSLGALFVGGLVLALAAPQLVPPGAALGAEVLNALFGAILVGTGLAGAVWAFRNREGGYAVAGRVR